MNTVSGGSPTDYLDSLLRGRPPASALSWLNQLRANAVDRVGALTVPTTRDEDWRFTDISPLTRLSFQPAQGAARLAPAAVGQWSIPEAAARLVFIDGIYAPEHSFNHAGFTVENLASGAASHGAAVQAQLGRHAAFERNAFTALNTAFLHDGALIVAPRDGGEAAGGAKDAGNAFDGGRGDAPGRSCASRAALVALGGVPGLYARRCVVKRALVASRRERYVLGH